MRFASSLRTAAAAPPAELKQEGRARTFGLPVWRQGKAYEPAWNVERAVSEGYEKVTWVFRCVNAIAKRVARTPKAYRRGDPDTGELVADHPLLPLFNSRPMPFVPGSPDAIARYFWQRVTAQYLLSKKGVFVEVIRRNLDNAPIGLAMLPPGITSPIPGSAPGRFLDGFEVKVPGRPRPLVLPPEDVIWVRDPHPLDPYLSQTPLEPLGLTVDSDWWAKVYNRMFLTNYGRPGMAIFVRGEISDEDADELKSRMSPGPGGAGRSAVIETVTETEQGTSPGGGVDVVDFAKTPADLSWLEGRKAAKEEILAGFACPESVAIGNASSRTFSNADAEYVTFWLDTLPDYASGILQPFDALDEDPTLFLTADFSKQREWQEVASMRAKSGLERLSGSGITVNEYRTDYENKDPVPGGDVILVAANRLPLGASSTPAAPDAPKTVDFGPFKLDAVALDAVKRLRDRRWTTWESSIAGHLRGYFARQERVVLEKLRSARTLRGTRHWEGKGADHAGRGDKSIDPGLVYDLDGWDRQILELMQPLWMAVLEDYGESVLRSLVRESERSGETGEEKAPAVEFDMSDPRVLEFLTERGRKIVAVNETTRQAIVGAIGEGEAAGEGIAAISTRIRQVFEQASRLRSTTIARTELLSASNEGSLDGARQSGVAERKVWLATDDTRTRDTHAVSDGQTVPVEQPFDIGGTPLMFPGDPAGPAKETIQCRCTMLFATSTGIVL